MRRSILRMVFVAALAGVCLGRPAWAQNREKAWELMPYLGYTTFEKVEGEKLLDSTMSYGFRFGYHWTKKQALEFGYFGAATQDSANLGLDVDLLGGEVNYVYNFFLQHRDKVVAFVTGGAGILGVSSFGFVSDPDLVGDDNYFTYNFGGGIRFFGGERAGLRIDARRVHFSDQGVDVDLNEFAVGLSIVLGGA